MSSVVSGEGVVVAHLCNTCVTHVAAVQVVVAEEAWERVTEVVERDPALTAESELGANQGPRDPNACEHAWRCPRGMLGC